MVAKANDRRTSSPDEFRGTRSDYVRQVELATTQQQFKQCSIITRFSIQSLLDYRNATTRDCHRNCSPT
ncbi:hypothetical protein TNCV_954501 [Trichonephila clavipes]|nr:hypothetical protein TNCV_954501 [Trichonephila clavipes]